MQRNEHNIVTAARIHAIVLTRDRPSTLRRCIATALSSLGSQDQLTIIDDSGPPALSANYTSLTASPNSSLPKRVHVSAERARNLIAYSLGAPTRVWLKKTATRDIAPLRNLSLLLAHVMPADMTILIDDDIHGFDLVATYHRVIRLAKDGGVIVGSDIGGINEQDTITRLGDAINRVHTQPTSNSEAIRGLFQVSTAPGIANTNGVRYASAGYLAFRLLPRQLFAFPPGYNEDWLWCLLHGANADVQILHSGESVLHDPPSVLRPTRDDLIFELIGDVVFQCLEDRDTFNDFSPEASLRGLSNQLPRPAFMPAARVMKLLEKAQSFSRTGSNLSVLEEYGLATLADMLLCNELNMDGARVLGDWCDDAIAKHQSVADTMSNEAAICSVRTLLQEGRL